MRTNPPDILAAGDCMGTWHRLLDRPAYLPLGTTAYQQGRVAGEACSAGSASPSAPPWPPSRGTPITTSGFETEVAHIPARRTLMNIALWIIAGLLAAGSLYSGAMKLTRPKEKLAASGMGWVEDFSAGDVKAIGTLEVLAGVGLVLPAALGIAPVLVPLAAVGLVVLMVGAIITHLRRHEARVIASPMALLALAVLVAWGRFGPQPFTG
jgi:uncharacterized membrane protein YphA (DoxX/SURF4 family)